MRQITCPVCRTSPKNHPEPQSICRCDSCGLRWTYLPQDLDAAALYSDEVYAVVDNRKSLFERIIFSEAKKVLRQARKISPSARKLLDFGSGKGQFLAVAKGLDWDGLGVETARERSDFAREKYRVDVLDEYYQGGVIKAGDYDLISLNHVLEHLPDPMAFMGELLGKNLSSAGLVYIEVPRADSWQASLAGKNWMHWDIPKHLTHWTQPDLVREFSKMGYHPVGFRSVSVHLGVLGMVQALLSKLGYRQNLILRLKQKKSLGLMLSLALVLPLAATLEGLSSLVARSGVVGIYLKRNG